MEAIFRAKRRGYAGPGKGTPGKLIGSSLQAELIHLPQQWREQLADFNDDLAELFIVSGCIVQEAEKCRGKREAGNRA